MNKIPGFEINYQLIENEKNSKKDQVSIDLVVYTAKKKWSAYTGLDNFGANDLGKYQASALVEAFTPFGAGDSLMFHGSTSNHPNRLSDVGVGYSHIINSYGTTAHFFAAHSEDNPTKGNAVSADNGTGESFRTAITHPLLVRAHKDLEFEIGTHYRNSTNYQVVNNVSQKYKVSKYTSGDIGLNYLFKDGLEGKNLANASYIHGLSGTFNNYIDNDIAYKHYKIIKFNFYRDQPLPNNFSIFAHIAASHSNDNLPDAEKSIFGGHEFGRGYSFATLDGTKMTAAALEIRYTKKMNDQYCMDHLQPYIFGDAGHMNRQDPSTNVSHLESAGAGLRIRFLKNIDLGMEVAHPFKKNFIVDNTSIKAETRFNVFINKVFEF